MIDEPVPTMPEMVPATSPTARTKSKLKAGLQVSTLLILRRRVSAVSKDDDKALPDGSRRRKSTSSPWRSGNAAAQSRCLDSHVKSDFLNGIRLFLPCSPVCKNISL